MKYLFLDDIRNPCEVTWVRIGVGKDYYTTRGAPWNVVRSFTEAVDWVNKNGFPDVISFDHDLGYEEYNTTDSGMVVVINAVEEKSGYDFAKWLVEYDMDNNAMPSHFTFTIHSKNPIGAKNIQTLLDNYIGQKRNT